MMPESRTPPMPAAHREFTIKVNDKTVSHEHQLTDVTISSGVNKIASAQLIYLDGAAATGSFTLADSLIFAPGNQIEILAGAGTDSTPIFIGQVIKIALRIRDTSAPQYLVECRHIAMKLTATEHNADFFDQSDSDIMSAILSATGIDADIESTSTIHEQVLQFQATDWDFLIARARANGQKIWCEDACIVTRKPVLTDPVCVLDLGATLIEFDGEIDARTQHTSIECESWNPANQENSTVTGNTPAFTPPGQLTSARLAEVTGQPRRLQHPALPENEAQAWADAVSLEERVDQVSGHAKCEGIATVKPGQTVELQGLGQCFNGKVFVSGVRHEFSLTQGWKTHIQFGGVHSETPPSPSFAALVPPISGLQIGVVVACNDDPSGEDRIRVKLPSFGLASEGIWARIASLDAGKDRGFFFRPEIGDEVTVGFLGDDPRHPVILGMLHSSAHPAPEIGNEDNRYKLYQSRAGMKVHFDDQNRAMTLSTPAGNRVVLDESQHSISLLDQNGNKLVMNAGGILIESASKIEIKAHADANMKGVNVDIKASATIKLEGSGGAELSGGGVTTVKGSLVLIN